MKKSLLILATIFVCLLPVVIFLMTVFSGSFSFWYDPARDLLLAWDNLHKLTLIGQPSGIPGIFYGPYWIWFLSLVLSFSKNPRIVDLIVATVPYCIIFPFILFKFSSILGKRTVVLVWLFFIYSDGIGYATTIWNPNLATLLFLILIYLMIFTDFTKGSVKNYIRVGFIGITAGLIINFNMALGIGVLLGSILFFFIDFITIWWTNQKYSNKIIRSRFFLSTFFVVGVFITFLPFFLFEYRHGFHQSQIFFKALTTFGNVVNIKGLSHVEILEIFFGRFGFILKNNWPGAYLLEIFGLAYFFWLLWSKKIKLRSQEKKLGLSLFTSSCAILFIFLAAKNPVWTYHFIGTEVIFLLLIGLIIHRASFLEKLLLVWVTYLVLITTISFLKSFKANPYSSSSLVTKEYIVDTVSQNAGKDAYTVFVYSPSIYTYDYSYLFRWRHNKIFSFDPNTIVNKNNLVYLIIPKISLSLKGDFIDYRTPDKEYKTVKIWQIPDGTEIYKRVKM